MKTALQIGASLPGSFPPQVRYALARLAVELDRQDATVAVRAVAELARLLELDPDVLASFVKASDDA